MNYKIIFSLIIMATLLMSMKSSSDNFDFPSAWKEVEKLSQDNLPKSILAKVNEIAKAAEEEDNRPQQIKATSYIASYKLRTEEDGLAQAIIYLMDEIKESKSQEVQAIKRVILADFYKQYLRNNAYRISRRTTDEVNLSLDYKTWSIETWVDKITLQYELAISDSKVLDIPIGEYKDILIHNGKDKVDYDDLGEDYIPTLYILFAEKAIQSFKEFGSYRNKAINSFSISDDKYFAHADTYTDMIIEDASLAEKILITFQGLLKYTKHKNQEAYLRQDLNRLETVNEFADYKGSKSDCILSLKRLAANNSSTRFSSKVLYSSALLQQAPYTKKGNVIAINICEEAINLHPKSQGAVDCENLILRIKKPEINITAEEVYTQDDPILYRMDYKNISTVYGKIVKVEHDVLDIINQRDRSVVKSTIGKLIPVRKWSTTLPNNQLYTTQSTEDYQDALPLGRYALIVSDTESFENAFYHAIFHVSRISYTQISDLGSELKFIVKDRINSEILNDASLDLYKSQYNSKTRRSERLFLTNIRVNNEGIATYQVKDRSQVSVVVKNGNDILDLRKYHSTNGFYSGNVHHTLEFFTDRSIYRPGQVVYFKGVVMQRDANQMPSIATAYPVTIVLRDPNYQEVETISLITNDFGSVTGEFTIPSGGLSGSFTLDAGFAQQQIQVEEYKRPTFEVTIDTLNTNYSLGQEVDISGNAKTFAGSSIGVSEVSYTVHRKTIYPFWRYNRGYGQPQTGEDLISYGETVTDDNGKFNFAVLLDSGTNIKLDSNPSFHFVVRVDITDVSGETRSNTYTLYAGVLPYILNLEISEIVDRSELKSLSLIAKNHANQEVVSSGNLKIFKLQAPDRVYKKRYWEAVDTHIISDREYSGVLSQYGKPGVLDQNKWESIEKVQEYSFNINGKGAIDLTESLAAGTYKFVLKAAGGVEFQKIVSVTDFEGEVFPNIKKVYHKLDKKRYHPGDQVNISFGSSSNITMMYAIESFGRSEGIRHIKINNSNQLSFKVKESDRGNIKFHIQYIHDNRILNESIDIPVDWSSKDLKIRYETIRDNLLPGSEQEWKMIVSGMGKDQLTAEVLVSMYDSSLDMFLPHDWNASWYPSYFSRFSLNTYGFNSMMLNNTNYQWNRVVNVKRPQIRYPRLKEFLLMSPSYGIRSKNRSGRPMASQAAPQMVEEAEMMMDAAANEEYSLNKSIDKDNVPPEVSTKNDKSKPLSIRRNLKETVFFYPNLMTDQEGSLIFSFKMNEALTSWKLQTFAHTKNLEYGLDQREVKTSQPLMIFPNKPRFLRQGDEIEITSKISNLTKLPQTGKSRIEFFDALTMQNITDQFVIGSTTSPFTIAGGDSKRVSWNCQIPNELQTAITYRITAESEDYTDGEENTVALLSNRQLVTETIPMHIKGEEQKNFAMKSLFDKSKTADPFKYTIELTSHPVWYAIQALPYMMKYPHECTEQVVNRYYSNALASIVANSHPKLKNVFDRWRGKDSDALLSNLTKNEELKSVLLEETPWVRAAQSEEAQKRNIALLFDLNRMSNEMKQTWNILEQRQLGSGGFPWFSGGKDSWYITQYLLEDLGHLRQLGIEQFSDQGLITKAVNYIDNRMIEQYETPKDDKDGACLTHMIVHYMYVRSFFPNVEKSDKVQKALDFYTAQAKEFWNKKSIYQQGMLGLSFYRNDIESETVLVIKKSLKERALTNDELGSYWRMDNGFYWYQLPIETHAMLMEFFTLVDNDNDFAENTKIWLLKQKQTTNWKTTKATSAAIYALLLNQDQKISDWVLESELVDMKVGGNEIVIDQGSVEAGTGYFKKSWNDGQIKSEMGKIELSNPNKSVAWGAAYYQYWEQMDNIKSYENNPLTIKREIHKVIMTDNGERTVIVDPEDIIEVGDKIRIRLQVVVDRPMEYVHLKDTRASGMEPIDVISKYRWQDGLGYYQSTKDVATHFFIHYLPVGTYIMEYDMRASIPGSFSTGIANIQSMYAPEFGAHSEGRIVKIVR